MYRLDQRQAEDFHLSARLLLRCAGLQRRMPAATGDVQNSVSVRVLGPVDVHQQGTARNHAERNISVDSRDIPAPRRRGFLRCGPLGEMFFEEVHHRAKVVGGILRSRECRPVSPALDCH